MTVIKQELQKSLINQVFINKIARNMKINDKPYFANELKKKIDDFSHKRAGTQLMNFKCLEKTLNNNLNDSIYEFDVINKKLMDLKKNNSEFLDLELYKEKLKKDDANLYILEDIFLKKYNDILNEIAEKKKYSNILRNNHADLSLSLKKMLFDVKYKIYLNKKINRKKF